MTVQINKDAVGYPAGKAVEDYCGPRCRARAGDHQKREASWAASALWSFFRSGLSKGCEPMFLCGKDDL
jgi:hypothetical protein